MIQLGSLHAYGGPGVFHSCNSTPLINGSILHTQATAVQEGIGIDKRQT